MIELKNLEKRHDRQDFRFFNYNALFFCKITDFEHERNAFDAFDDELDL